jgi:hypothetical protein
MIHKLVLALAATSLVGVAAASAGEQSGKSKRGDPNKLICKTMEENGQKLRKVRACHTAAEWAELRRQTRAAIEHIQNSRATNY